jgi:hypothetical protein
LKAAKKTDIHTLEKQIENLCKYDDLKILYNKVVPAVQGFEENLIDIERDVETYKQIVNRFDEVIIQKASKVSLANLEEDLRNYIHNNQYREDQMNEESRF